MTCLREDRRKRLRHATMDASKTDKHLGPLVMRERVEMAGGVFSISSFPERGTTVRAEIPLEEATSD